MRRVLTVIRTILPTLIFAQSAIPTAVNEYLSPAPRMERGDNQRYYLEVDYQHLDSNGLMMVTLRNWVKYSQLCLLNSKDSLRFEVVIDSFATGMTLMTNNRVSRKEFMTDFYGYSFKLPFSKQIPASDGCFDPSDILEENLNYIQAQEFLDHFTLIRLLEQFRFMAGRRLGYLGDSITISFPGPICYEIPGLVMSYELLQQPCKIKVLGLSKYHNDPCVLLRIESMPSPFTLELLTRDERTVKARGSKLLDGEFMISLKSGVLVSADLRERLTAVIGVEEEPARMNNRIITTRLRAVN